MDKPCVYTGPGGSVTARTCYLVQNGSIYEGNPTWNVLFHFPISPVLTEWVRTTVGPIPKGSEHFRSNANVALKNVLENLLESFG